MTVRCQIRVDAGVVKPHALAGAAIFDITGVVLGDNTTPCCLSEGACAPEPDVAAGAHAPQISTPPDRRTGLPALPNVLALSAIEQFEHRLKYVDASDCVWFNPHLHVADPLTRQCPKISGKFLGRIIG